MSDATGVAVVERKTLRPRVTSSARATDADRPRDAGRDRPARAFVDRTVSERFRPFLFGI